MPPIVIDLLSLLAIGATILLSFAWLAAGQIIRRRKPDPPCLPSEFNLPFEHVIFKARDGVELGGWLVGEDLPAPTVIFCAGITGSMDGDTHMLPAFIEAGFNVLQFNWRAHGNSDGRHVTFGVKEVSDLQGAIDFLQARGVRKIGLLGFSMGGAIALHTAAIDQRITCVVSDGGFARSIHAVEGGLREKIGLRLRPLARLILLLAGLRTGVDLTTADTVETVTGITCSVFFIQGADDPFVPVTAQDQLAEACPTTVYLWRVDGAAHREAYQLHPTDYIARVTGFFKQQFYAQK